VTKFPAINRLITRLHGLDLSLREALTGEQLKEAEALYEKLAADTEGNKDYAQAAALTHLLLNVLRENFPTGQKTTAIE
jgi:hypothetical protein